MLRAGYVDIHNLNDRTQYDDADVSVTSLGVPQGSVLSPLLANIYFHQLDVQLIELQNSFNLGDSRSRGHEYKCLFSDGRRQPFGEMESALAKKYPELKSSILQAERNATTLKDIPSRKPDDAGFKRLYWVRYADDILIGVIGSHDDCKKIAEKVSKILESVQLKAQADKTSITHTKTTRTKFLGADLTMPAKNRIVKKYKNNLKTLSRVALTKMQLYVPVENIIKRLLAKGYVIHRNDGKSYRARRHNKYCTSSEYDIVMHFSSMIRGLVNYYSFASQRSDL
jgi:hypothetical protein